MKIRVLSLALAVIAAAACSTDTLSVKGEFFGVTSQGDSTMLYTMTKFICLWRLSDTVP